jgi:hypothetical protein
VLASAPRRAEGKRPVSVQEVLVNEAIRILGVGAEGAAKYWLQRHLDMSLGLLPDNRRHVTSTRSLPDIRPHR